MEVRAHLRHLRLAPRKVRAVVDLVRGMPVDTAIDQLTILPRGAAQPVLKLLNSAIANAEHNFKLDRHSLRIKSIVANEGPRLKRFQPRAFGRAAEILKRSTHITIILEDAAKSARPDTTTTKVKTSTVPAEDIKQAPAEPKSVKLRATKGTATKADVHAAKDKTIRRQGHE